MRMGKHTVENNQLSGISYLVSAVYEIGTV
jgi:hypothetical protein